MTRSEREELIKQLADGILDVVGKHNRPRGLVSLWRFLPDAVAIVPERTDEVTEEAVAHQALLIELTCGPYRLFLHPERRSVRVRVILVEGDTSAKLEVDEEPGPALAWEQLRRVVLPWVRGLPLALAVAVEERRREVWAKIDAVAEAWDGTP